MSRFKFQKLSFSNEAEVGMDIFHDVTSGALWFSMVTLNWVK